MFATSNSSASTHSSFIHSLHCFHKLFSVDILLNKQSKMGLSSFDVMTRGEPSSPLVKKGSWAPLQGSLCFAVEGIMTNLFTPDFDCSSDKVVLEEKPSPAYSGNLTPRKICKLWRVKRRAQKRELLEMREGSPSLFSDIELQSETKQNALQIQRSFEKKFDEKNYSQRYEKYGSRAHFIRDRNMSQ